MLCLKLGISNILGYCHVSLDQLCIYFSIYISVLRTLSPSYKSWVVRTRRRGPPHLHRKINSQLNENQIVGHIFIGKKVTALSVLLSVVGVYTFKWTFDMVAVVVLEVEFELVRPVDIYSAKLTATWHMCTLLPTILSQTFVSFANLGQNGQNLPFKTPSFIHTQQWRKYF